MKKTLAISIIIFVVATMSVSAFGIGFSAGIDPVGGLPGTDLMLSLKLDEYPFLFGFGFTVWGAQNRISMGITGDYWLLNDNLVDMLNWYFGLGFYGGLQLGDTNDFQIGARIPIGLNLFPIDVLEIFAEIAPTITQQFRDPFKFPDPNFGLQGAFGLRFWSRG